MPMSRLVAGPFRISKSAEKSATPNAPSATISAMRRVRAGRNSGPRKARTEAAISAIGARKVRMAIVMGACLLGALVGLRQS
jgi:hypothetical protein